MNRVYNDARADSHLLARIDRIVPLEHTITKIAGNEYPWTQVKDTDRLLLRALANDDSGCPEFDPFWAATWRASTALEMFLDRLNLQRQRVLDLGCGSGRVAIGAAMRGAQVVATDLVGAAMLVTRYNGRMVKHNLTVRRLNWNDDVLDSEPFSIIVGSDIVYDPQLHPILEPCLRRHLGPNGRAFLSEPQRETGDRFANWIRSAGWQLVEHFVDLRDDSRNVRIFELSLK